MTDLYEQRIDAMKARERAMNCNDPLFWSRGDTIRNIDRLAAYKCKRAALASVDSKGVNNG